MKTYEEYRESGIEWLGEIPAHWELKKLKFCVDLNTNEGEIENVATRIALENIESKTGKYLPTDTPAFEGVGNLFNAGDILFSKLRPYLAKVLQAETNGIAVGEVLVLTPRKDEYFSRFLLYRLLSQSFIEVVDSSTYGSKMPRANWGFIGEIKLPVPPLPEQRAIATYLDRKTAQLDTLLAQKEALLQKLHQKRQALINEAVTQGLDPAAPRKPSGVAWLGDVPAHWEVKKLKYCVQLNSNEIEDDGAGLRVALENIESKTGKYLSTETAPFEGPGNYFKTGDVLFSKLRPYLAKALLAPQNGVAVGEILVLSPLEKILNNDFLLNRVLSPSFIEVVDSSTYGSKMPRASWNFIGDMKIAIPPLQEQQAIVYFIEDITGKINEATAAIHIQIQTLKAYRQSLISEVVTGKVDVRPAAAVAPVAAGTQTQLWN